MYLNIILYFSFNSFKKGLPLERDCKILILGSNVFKAVAIEILYSLLIATKAPQNILQSTYVVCNTIYLNDEFNAHIWNMRLLNLSTVCLLIVFYSFPYSSSAAEQIQENNNYLNHILCKHISYLLEYI